MSLEDDQSMIEAAVFGYTCKRYFEETKVGEWCKISSCKIKEYCGSNDLDFRGNTEMVPANDDESHRLCLLPTFADYKRHPFLHCNSMVIIIKLYI